MRSACMSALLVLLACGPSGSTQPPEPAPAEPVADAAAPTDAPESTTPAAEPDAEAGADGGAEAGADGGSESAGTVASAEAAGDPSGTGQADPAPAPEPETAPAPEPEPAPTAVAAKDTLKLPKPVHAKVDAKCGRDAGVGQPLKSFSLPNMKGDKKITSGTFRGRVQVVNFWGTWCKPCLKELPEFDHLYRRYRKHGMTLLAIATDEDAEAVQAAVTKKKLGAKIAIAGEAYANQYGSPKFPFTFVVDHKGVIRGSYRGYKPECMGKLEADIREQLQVRAEARARRKKKKSS